MEGLFACYRWACWAEYIVAGLAADAAELPEVAGPFAVKAMLPVAAVQRFQPAV